VLPKHRTIQLHCQVSKATFVPDIVTCNVELGSRTHYQKTKKAIILQQQQKLYHNDEWASEQNV